VGAEEISYGLDSVGFDSSGLVRAMLGLTSISGFEGSLPRKVGGSLVGFPLWLCRKHPSRQGRRSGDIIFRRKQHRSSETEDEINERLSRVPGAVFAEWGFNYLKVLMAVTSVGVFFLVSTGLFATKVYPRIWFSLGGGQARQVVFWLGPVSGIASDSVLERDRSNPEYTVTYELLLENENSLVVISPKGGRRQSYLTERPLVRSYC
jgi:hypothetical protein